MRRAQSAASHLWETIGVIAKVPAYGPLDPQHARNHFRCRLPARMAISEGTRFAGLALTQTDLSLRRQFKLRESVSLQARAEVFNLFNHPNFGSPAAALNNANFSISTQMLGRSLGSSEISAGFSPLYQVGGPRSLQLALRLQF